MNSIKFRVAINPNGCFRVDFAYPHPISGAKTIETHNLEIPATVNHITHLVEHIMDHMKMIQDNMKNVARDNKKKAEGKRNG